MRAELTRSRRTFHPGDRGDSHHRSHHPGECQSSSGVVTELQWNGNALVWMHICRGFAVPLGLLTGAMAQWREQRWRQGGTQMACRRAAPGGGTRSRACPRWSARWRWSRRWCRPSSLATAGVLGTGTCCSPPTCGSSSPAPALLAAFHAMKGSVGPPCPLRLVRGGRGPGRAERLVDAPVGLDGEGPCRFLLGVHAAACRLRRTRRGATRSCPGSADDRPDPGRRRTGRTLGFGGAGSSGKCSASPAQPAASWRKGCR